MRVCAAPAWISLLASKLSRVERGGGLVLAVRPEWTFSPWCGRTDLSTLIKAEKEMQVGNSLIATVQPPRYNVHFGVLPHSTSQILLSKCPQLSCACVHLIVRDPTWFNVSPIYSISVQNQIKQHCYTCMYNRESINFPTVRADGKQEQMLSGCKHRWIKAEAVKQFLSIGQPLLTQLQRPLECSPPKHFNVACQPGDHVPGDVSTAVGHGLDLDRLQNAVPNVHLTQLAHEGLSRVKAPAHHVLWVP